MTTIRLVVEMIVALALAFAFGVILGLSAHNPTEAQSSEDRHDYLVSGIVVTGNGQVVTPFSWVYWEPSAKDAYTHATNLWKKGSTNREPAFCILNVIRLDQ